MYTESVLKVSEVVALYPPTVWVKIEESKGQLEEILFTDPEKYVGSLKLVKKPVWVFDIKKSASMDRPKQPSDKIQGLRFLYHRGNESVLSCIAREQDTIYLRRR